MKNLRLFLLYLLPTLLWMGLIFWWSGIPNLELHGELAPFDLVLRKLAHITEYAILAILIYRALLAFLKKELQPKVLTLTLVISILYAVSDEAHQFLVPTRDGKIFDVLIDVIGIILGIWLYHKWRHFDDDRH